MDVVTVTAAWASEHVFNVTADYVTISRFTATGATGSGKAGISLSGVYHCNVSYTNASGNDDLIIRQVIFSKEGTGSPWWR